MINLFLIIVVILASFLRLVNLGTLPISLFGDEVDVGYQSWSLITTGRDYMGHLLPTYIQSLSEWRAPLLMYITAPFVGIFGPNAFAIRLPVAILGICSVTLIFFLAKSIFKNEKIALLSALFLAVTPWHIHYSRASFEVVPLIFLEMLGAYLFINKKEFWSFVPFALTLYTYSTASVFTPLFVFALYLIYKPAIIKPKNIWKVIPSILVALPLIYSVFFGQAAGRFKGISVFSDQKIIDAIILQRTDPWVKASPIETFFHNKYFAIASAIGQNYITSFSSEFLFLSGDPIFRHSVGGQGELLWVLLPFFAWGIILCGSTLKEKSSQLLITWLLIAPIASSLTQGGGNHATRLFVMIPPIVFITARGAQVLLTKSKIVFAIFVLALIFSLSNFWHRYSDHYKYESARFWHNGYAQIFTQLKPLIASDKKIYINNTYEPALLRFALFTQLKPVDFQREFSGDNPDSFKSELFSGFVFGQNIYFGQVKDVDSIQSLLAPGDIYLAAQGKEISGDWDWSKNPPAGLTTLGSVTDVFGHPQFAIVTKK